MAVTTALVSSSCNLGAKSGLKKFDMCPELPVKKCNKITSNNLLISAENRNEKGEDYGL